MTTENASIETTRESGKAFIRDTVVGAAVGCVGGLALVTGLSNLSLAELGVEERAAADVLETFEEQALSVDDVRAQVVEDLGMDCVVILEGYVSRDIDEDLVVQDLTTNSDGVCPTDATSVRFGFHDVEALLDTEALIAFRIAVSKQRLDQAQTDKVSVNTNRDKSQNDGAVVGFFLGGLVGMFYNTRSKTNTVQS